MSGKAAKVVFDGDNVQDPDQVDQRNDGIKVILVGNLPIGLRM